MVLYVLIFVADDELELLGLAEHLFEKLTASPAEPHLKTLQELYINFNRA